MRGFAACTVCVLATLVASGLLCVVPSWTDAHIPHLLSFGAGAVLGDVFLHSLPHLYARALMINDKNHHHQNYGHNQDQNHDHNYDHNYDRNLGQNNDQNHDHHHDHNNPGNFHGNFNHGNFHTKDHHHGHSHGHGHGHSHEKQLQLLGLVIVAGIAAPAFLHRPVIAKTSTPDNATSRSSEKKDSSSGRKTLWAKLQARPMALKSLQADFLHNAVDGLCLASTAAVLPEALYGAVVAAAAHELAQELADFTVLRINGLTFGEATLANGVVGCSVYVGWFLFRVLELVDGRHEGGLSVLGFALSDLVASFAVGNFLNLALSEMVPLIGDHQNKQRRDVLAAMLVAGVALTVAVAELEG